MYRITKQKMTIRRLVSIYCAVLEAVNYYYFFLINLINGNSIRPRNCCMFILLAINMPLKHQTIEEVRQWWIRWPVSGLKNPVMKLLMSSHWTMNTYIQRIIWIITLMFEYIYIYIYICIYIYMYIYLYVYIYIQVTFELDVGNGFLSFSLH